MNLYRMISNGVFSRHSKTGEILSKNIEEPLVQVPMREVSFSSLDLVSLVESDILNTEDPMTIAKYKSNLKILKENALKNGYVDQFRFIREDDIFPYDWMWRVNSNQTAREYAKSHLAYSLRMEEARSRISNEKRDTVLTYGFEFPGNSEEENRIASSLGPYFGQVYEPTKFRSTKHFTINTALPYTGSYNQVSSGRRFVVIDKPDLFCQSGYGYSADYQDAYLDVTHEPLPISEEAIVLIEESKYPEIIQDDVIRKQLQERKTILYRGEEATAINMVLSQEGVLPYRPGGKFMEYDPELETIMEQSMKDFCARNHLEYSHNHGNMFGQGGHFSDLFDSENDSRRQFEEEFISYLQLKLPDYKDLIQSTFYQFPDKIIRLIGHSKILDAIHDYNDWAHQEEVRLRKEYDYDRSRITPEIHQLFVDTIKMIRDYFSSHNQVEDNLLLQNMLLFFHSTSLEEQVEAAHKVHNCLLNEQKQY